MNAPLRRSGVVILVLFGMLFANLNWIQAYKADEYRTDPRNNRVQVAEYERPRGKIEAGTETLASNTETDGELKYQRIYPKKEIYAPVLGYKPVVGAEVGIEAAENDILSGSSDKLFADRLSDMFTGNNTGGGNIIMSLNPAAQEVAWKQMTKNERGVTKGAAVAIDPTTGAVQALVSMPSYDPNPLASHDGKVATDAYKKLIADKDQPLLNRGVANTLPPGSVMKVIISAAALQAGYNLDTSIPAGSVYQEGGATIRNSEDEVCPGNQITLKDALTTSCNTGFSKLGVKLGRDVVMNTAKAFGFEDESLRVGDLEATDRGLAVAASRTGAIANEDGSVDKSALAQSSLGQRDVRMTPLLGAMIAASVANDGKQMRPYLVQQQLDSDRRTIYTAKPKVLREPIDAAVAGNLRDMMVSVVQSGTGKNAKISGFKVGGKTGTAQNAEGADPHGWFIGFAYDENGKAVSAVCVMLENVPGGHASAEAARIAGLIMKAAANRGGN
ncbi:penicillin-binding transpeptidase domain-containing protein [Actinoplanes sp. NEAU-A12]|uniref:Penicillin-binding transpeptidase domain-containing protein n=1 Tax=Actinoplanes sandaracinus TaxID=3045177 RepID=A0ABT6WH27_9ACTN|nr:penicillin-binding transpeptidase domain-containing protein [Actinoplanes sandaracinus]MDI6099029.1 penicillin-binding transpeptidase domain-containing protein [Actinoplanes sandaracinus]MDI6102924.1 penicillin-binding transpeptidase domain-containing protein [Actinoplanes sandaracinus]